MRVSPPEQLRLDPASLLADLRDRLAARDPRWAEQEPDPADPAWMLVEQCAWMVGQLSEQLDRYPLAVFRQFVHLLGVDRLAARPALGVLALRCRRSDRLVSATGEPAACTFISAQTEQRDLLEFELVEQDVPLAAGRLSGLFLLQDRELWDVTPTADSLEIHQIPGGRNPSRAFDVEQVHFSLAVAQADALLDRIQRALASFTERGISWLRLEAGAESDTLIRLTVTIDPLAAFATSAPGGVVTGTQAEGTIRTLDNSPWTPGLRLAGGGGVPLEDRGMAVRRGLGEGEWTATGLPAQVPLASLVMRCARPAPNTFLEAIWRDLAQADTALMPIRPSIRRAFGEDGAPPPDWILSFADGPGWDAFPAGKVSGAEVILDEASDLPVRIGVVRRAEDALAPPQIWGRADGTTGRSTLVTRELWALPCPPDPLDPVGTMRTIHVFEAQPDGLIDGLLIVVRGETEGFVLNPVLASNLPTVRDGRSIRVERAVPEVHTLGPSHLVTRSVLDLVAAESLPGPVAEALRRLPVASLQTPQGPLADWKGVAVDATAGLVTLGAPDPSGETRALRPGTEVELRWFRRTDGAAGNVEAGAIQFVERSPDQTPEILAVTNPLPFFGGADAETEEDCMRRVFGGSQGTPFLPADWERELQAAIGAGDVFVRCWGYGERTLVPTLLWPLAPHPSEVGAEDPRRLLQDAGPETLVFAVGPRRGIPTRGLIDRARLAANALVSRVRRRGGGVRGALVIPLWPLELQGGTGELNPGTHEVSGLGGQLVDAERRSSPIPSRGLLLNAIVTGRAGAT